MKRHDFSYYRRGYIAKIADAIGAGCDSQDKEETPVTIKIPGDRTIRGSYYRCKESEIDIADHKSDVIWDTEELQKFVSRLMESGMPFVTETGNDDMVCTLRWTI